MIFTLPQAKMDEIYQYILGELKGAKTHITRAEVFTALKKQLQLSEGDEPGFVAMLSDVVNREKFPGLVVVKGRYGGIRRGKTTPVTTIASNPTIEMARGRPKSSATTVKPTGPVAKGGKKERAVPEKRPIKFSDLTSPELSLLTDYYFNLTKFGPTKTDELFSDLGEEAQLVAIALQGGLEYETEPTIVTTAEQLIAWAIDNRLKVETEMQARETIQEPRASLTQVSKRPTWVPAPEPTKHRLILNEKKYDIPMSIVAITNLLTKVIGAEIADVGQVMFENIQYNCTEAQVEMLDKFLFYQYGANLLIEA